MQQVLIHQILLKRLNLLEKLDTVKLINISSGSNSFKIKVHKLDADKLETVLIYLKKLNDIVD